MSGHGNPVLGLRGPAAPGQLVTVADGRGRPVWRSHPLAAGRRSVRVDVRDGRFVGHAAGWCLLPPGRYAADVGGGPAAGIEVQAVTTIEVDFSEQPYAAGETDGIDGAAATRVEAGVPAPLEQWLPREVAWHTDGSWRARRGGIEAADGRAYLFMDGAMHGQITARFQAAGAESAACWGLLARHFNGNNHLRLVLRRDGAELAVALERVAAGSDPDYRDARLAAARVPCNPEGVGEICWHFNGTSHQVALDGEPLLSAHDAYMGGVEVVGLFAESRPGYAQPRKSRAADAQPSPAGQRSGLNHGAESAPVWASFALTSSQWVAKHRVGRGDYAAVVRAGNIHQLHLSPAPGREPATFDPRTNVMWESGIQVGHIGGSEIKFTQGSALDLLATGEVADLVRWRGPLPRFVEQDDDVRGYAHGTAAFYHDRIVVSDWVAVRVRRSVGPDFDLLARALTAPARVALGSGRTFVPWELDGDGLVAELTAASGRQYYPVALVFPLQVQGTRWHLIAVVGGLRNVGGPTPGRAVGWQCPRGLTASHGVRVAATVPGTEYGHWIAVSWLATADTAAAEAAARALRAEFQHPATLTAQHGSLAQHDPKREQPAAALALDGSFDRAVGAYRVALDGEVARFTFDPGQVRRCRPVFIVAAAVATGAADTAAGEPSSIGDTVVSGARAGSDVADRTAAGTTLACSLDGQLLRHGHEYLCQTWAAGAGGAAYALQLRCDVTHTVTVELRVSCGG